MFSNKKKNRKNIFEIICASRFFFFCYIPVSMFPTDFFVCGISPYGDHVVVLTYDEEGAVQQVQLCHYNYTVFSLCYVGN